MRQFAKHLLPLLCCLLVALCLVPMALAAEGGEASEAADYETLYSEYSVLLADSVVATAGDMSDAEHEALLVRWASLSSVLYGEAGQNLTDEQYDALSAIDLEIYLKLAGNNAIMLAAANDPDDSYTVSLNMVADPVPFSVTLPSTIAISVDEYGVATAANFTVTNNSIGDVKISSLSVETANGWELKSYDNNFLVNEKSFGLKINGDDVADGFNAAAVSSIAKDDTLTLPVAALVATQTEGYSGSIGNIVFVVSWVENGPVVGIEITTEPDKTSYSAGETFDTTGMVVTAIHADGTGEVVTDYTVDPTTMTYGTTGVNITYGGYTKTVNVSVDRTLAGVSVTTPPTKTTYNAGETFDATGMVVTASYAYGDSEAVTNYTVEPSGALSAGTTEVTISYTEGGVTKTATTPITVERISAGDVPSQSNTLTYNTSAQSPTWSGYDDGKMTLTGSTSETNAGTYTVTFTPKANYKWSDGTTEAKNVNWTIGKADFTATVSISGYTYAGTKSTPSVSNNPGNGTVTYYGRSARGGTATAWSSVTNTTYNAGTRYIYATIAETTNYKSYTTAETSFTVARATPSKPTVSKSSVSLGTGTTSTTFTVTRSGDGAVTATSSNTGVATVSVSGTTVTVSSVNNTTGTATITVKVNQGTNYNAYTASDVTVSVSAQFKTTFEAASVGSVVTGGTFKINGVTTAPATVPYSSSYSSGGNLPAYNSSNTYTFGDSEGNGKDLKWVKVSDTLFIADRNLLCSISWNDISSLGFLNGSKTVTIEGKTYKIRLLTGGSTSSNASSSEWNTYIVNGTAGTSDSVWHWTGCYSWTSETTADGISSYRPFRGYRSVSYWYCNFATYTNWYYGFRPALELVP